ncbi:hypothetical protein HPB50_020555 [Hyalomma asiaticum]|uniref:Uncharacterized protein n=1 Tax=Hyalomma asiaticum TaxID=266040 RepID=A0ACB7TL21_HYAAI|nr:hypothetical protein HPB50_020555 [Hyalomma asiaticum]
MCDRFGLVLELVSQALSQDDRNEFENAYVNYLKSLDAIADSLLKDYESHVHLFRKLQGSGECITPEEKRQQELFARILQYENNREWPPALQDMLESHQNNSKVARHVVMHILGDSKHPLSQWLAKERVALQRDIVMALDSRSRMVAAPKELSSGGIQRSVACARVESVLRTALLLLGLALEPLKDPAAQEVCYSVLEDHFTWPLWPHLLATVRLENLSGEKQVAATMSQLASASAEEMHISQSLQESPALSEAVGMLRTVPRLGPSHKLRVLGMRV